MSIISVIFGFPFIDSLIKTRLVFSACGTTFKNTFTIFQSKVQFSIFHQELRHRRLIVPTLARTHIMWGGHVLTQKFKTLLPTLNSRPLTKFLAPVLICKAIKLNQKRGGFCMAPTFGCYSFSFTFYLSASVG